MTTHDATARHGTARYSTVRYSTVAIVLHWLIAALLIFEVGLGLRMEAAQGTVKFAVFQLHKSIGITILLLVALRLVWRFYRKPPAITAQPWERLLAHIVHWAFYGLLFALPISGWIIISTSRIVVPTLLYGIVPWPHLPGFTGLAAGARDAWNAAGEFVHVNLVKLLYLLFALHVAGALKHHFIDRDPDIARMAPGTRAGAWLDPRVVLIGVGVVLAAGLGLAWLPIGKVPAPAQQAQPAMEAAPVSSTEPAAASQNGVVADEAPAAADGKELATQAEALSEWAIAKSSTILFRTSWSGDPIDGGFRRFEGDIAFSPDQLDKSKVEIRIDTGSVFSGDDQRDETLRSPDWFNAPAFGTALFKADRFRKTGKDRYVASGTLRLKGVTLPLDLPFSLQIAGDNATMRGTATIDRLAYKVGEGEFSTPTDIPAAVAITVQVQARRK